MDRELLVRTYNVGLGDCIYLQVPDGDDELRHILIDCGNKFGTTEDLENAVRHLEGELPAEADGRKRLDLLVVTHPHEDHVRGFDPALFENIHIHRIWLSASMNPDHPQAQGFRAVQGFAERALESLAALALDERQRAHVESLLELTKAAAVEALLVGLPDANGIEPLFVHADTPAQDLQVFEDPDINLQVLGPMEDIDLFYLGKIDTDVNALRALGARLSGLDEESITGVAKPDVAYPTNIGAADFDRLRTQLISNAMQFVLSVGHLVNNTSVVLLLEWEGRRLLFPGDAEVKITRKGQFEEGKTNGSWNVMWAKRHDALNARLDFLKIGHHGSHNATPWTAKTITVKENGESVEKPHPVNEILDALLPETDPQERTGHAIVSTKRTNAYETIPDPALMQTLGKRVLNIERYEEQPVKGVGVANDIDQPWRTDQKGDLFLERRFPPVAHHPT